MRKEYELEGRAYSVNKADFKRILKNHGLKWKGSMNNFVWMGKGEKVTAYFERDEQRDITLKARLVWEGKKKTEFLSELVNWVSELKGREVSQRGKPSKKSMELIQKELEFWDKIHRPPVERMKAEGRPESWISRDIENWKMRRKEKEKELRRKYA